MAAVGKRIVDVIKNRGIGEAETTETVQARIGVIEGLTQQIQYLQDIDAQVRRESADLQARAAALTVERDRYSSDSYRYRIKRFTDEQFAKRFGRADRFGRRAERYRSVSSTIYSFDAYDRANLSSDFLWWDLMTDGRYDGNFVPEVASYRQTHPDYSYERGNFASMPSADRDRELHRDDS